MASALFDPLQQFRDTDGKPLEDGYIYIGTANQNAQTNPITVYWDQAGTIPAAQPIRTSGGFPVRAGAAARVYVAADDYSIVVRDKNSRLVMSKLTVDEFSSAFIQFTQSGAGAVTRTAQDKMRDTVSVKDFGAVGDGVTDDTVAIQAAINSSAGNLAVYFPAGTYKVTSQITIFNDRVMLHGDGVASKILFVPTANAACFLFDKGSTSSVQNAVRDLAFYSTDTTYTKTAIKLVDVSQCLIDNVQTLYPHWFGNGSTFLHVLGRDSTAVRGLYVFADKPIRISPIPAPHVAAGIGIDHFHFSDCYIGNTTSANPLITIDDGVFLTHTTFTGHQAWVGGNHGLYWNDTTSAQVSIALRVENVRWEQASAAGGWMFYINRTANSLAQLEIVNCYSGAAGVNGIYLRKTEAFTIDNFWFDPAAIALNADSGCSFGQVNLTANNNSATVSLTAVRTSGKYRIGGNVYDLTSSAPSGSNLYQRWNPSKTLGFSQMEPQTFSVPAASNVAFATNALQGLVFIYANFQVSAVMAVNGTGNSTRKLVESDAGWFGTTLGAANINLYWDGGTSTYRIQNTLGSSATFHVVTVGQGER